MGGRLHIRWNCGIVIAVMMFGVAGCNRSPDNLSNAQSTELKEAAAEQARLDDAAALAAAIPIDPKMIDYRQVAAIATEIRVPRALAVDADNRIYVGGDKIIRRYSATGVWQADFPLSAEPRCLAVGGPEPRSPQIFVGLEDHVEVIRPKDTQDAEVTKWASIGDHAAVTSIAVADDEVFVADAGNRIVRRYDLQGKLLGRIGAADPKRHVPGFMITSHFFDLAAGPDGLLYVVNPRAMRIEGYTRQGDLEVHWGKASPAVEDFFGCCNPAQLAVLADGRFVTAEKGIPRIKVYSREGQMQHVVAGPAQLNVTPADLAVDARQRILVLDPTSSAVRIFVRNSPSTGANP